MERIITRNTIAAILLVALVGCGGEGSGSTSSGAAVAGTPAPSPTPSPTPSPVVDNGTGTISTYAPFGVTTDTEMDVIGWFDDGSGSRWLEPGEIALKWLAGPRTFAATFPVYGAGTVTDDPDNLARSASYLIDGNGTRLASTNFYIPGMPRTLDLNYLVGWFASPGAQSKPVGYFAYFSKSAIKPPVSGQATYGIPERYTDGSRVSKATLAIDFATGVVSGMLSITYSDAWGPYPETFYPIEDGTYDRSTGRITGTFKIPGSGFDGSVRGQVLGADGKAAVVLASGAVQEPYEGKWQRSTHIAGFLNEQ